jgi:predicted P-loop ATPase
MLIDYCDAEDTVFNMVAAAKWMIAAVRRVRKPGTLVRNVLIIEGTQGSGKSGFLKVISVKPEWFLDNLPIHEKSKDTMSQLRGKWIIEFAELSALKKSDVEKAKAFITATEDTDRLAYARRSTTIPRQCILAGTTNQDAYLKDATGGARFWPVKVGKTNFPKLKADLHQLWAEAAHREQMGESHELNVEETELARVEQDSRFAVDPWEELVAEFLSDANGDIKDVKVRGETLFNVLGVAKERRTQAQLERLGGILKRLGFERKPVRFGGKLAKGYVIGSGSIEKM